MSYARDLVFHFDRLAGEGLEYAVRRHHARRLKKLGWERALDPSPDGWAAAYPVRTGNSIEVLIDGEQAFPAITEAIADARSHVHYAGWYINPNFGIVRGDEELAVRDLLEETARRIPVRVLMWAGAPLPWRYETSRPDVHDRAVELCRNSRVHYAADSRERPLHCHHEKIIVVDDEVAFVDGIEPTVAGGDRFDSNDHGHRGQRGWHDAGTRLRGPIVADVADHFRVRWKEVVGEELPARKPSASQGDVEAQIVRTVPEKIYGALPTGDFSILESYTRALRSARRLIYIENQFLWSPHIVDILHDHLHDPPSSDFRVVLVLPSRPTTGMDDTMGQLGLLVQADRDDRLLACTLRARAGARSEQIYVHAKVGIVDDRWLTIGSANLNNHSLFNDTEMNVVTHDADLTTQTRRRLWAEHLEMSEENAAGDPAGLIDEVWRPTAAEQLRRFQEGKPLTHRLVALPHLSKRSKRFIGPLQGLFVDG